jgi:hypothetical protein
MRSLTLVILTFEMLLVHDAGRLAAAQEGNDPALVRIRAENPFIAALIRDATGWSTTFRGLIETICATNGLVYVEDGTYGHNVRACLVLSVQVAGPFRLLRVLVNRRGKADCDLMASIGRTAACHRVLRDTHITDTQPSTFFSDDRSTASGDSKQRRQLMWATTRPRSVRSKGR